jgi:NAD(P)-dependent dehydrogenase (short-subunit alcohol dehydrogenase family)
MKNVVGRTAVITGGVSGIGLGVAKAFAAAGMNLALTYRREDHRDSALAWFREHGYANVRMVKLDVTDREGFLRAADDIEAAFGEIHVLCNNAGMSIMGPMDEATYDDWDWVLNVNLGGVINGLVTFLPRIKRHGQGGHIINVASMAAYLAVKDVGLYTTTKFAVRGLTEALRQNVRQHGIGVSLMCPGLTRSNIHESALGRPDRYADTAHPVDVGLVGQFGQMMALGMDPDEVGRKTLNGMLRDDPVIFTHPEFREELRESFEQIVAAFPDEPAPPERVALEEGRRAAKRRALGEQS